MAKVSFLLLETAEDGKDEAATITVYTETEFTTISDKKMYQEAREKLERVVGLDMANKCHLIG